MKAAVSLALLVAVAGAASAHNIFPNLIVDGTVTGDWEFVRTTANKWSREGLTNVNSESMRCYEEAGRPPSEVKTVKAGSRVGFASQAPIRHIGPVLFYMARVPDGQDVDSWTPSGDVWFKIHQQGPERSESGWTWPTQDQTELFVDIPASVPDGNYLLRIEQIALHDAQYVGGAQFYLACGQINVTGGGSGDPGPKVSFPGAYKPTDPGILLDLHGHPPANYQFPGPAVWQG
ncbi:hypothetical protein VTO42DRAFT_8187 [Malbranchea cinnamomea]|uniref:AA9 family lytic polysaccharide monooxygenase C n=1 Tax=Malbranchea cinnamomea TaxID=5041 RepID=LP9C_MALCI|nr:putative family AA9 lytic polysaccharide monooxygenase [Malbranchea cinnamomea]QCQ84226.1 putative family AA9 lytic polysaccharide monooxygenase [Malbranchea cinnamomea]